MATKSRTAASAEAKKVEAILRNALPDIDPIEQSGMLGWCKFRYRYESGREGDAFRIALAQRAAGISVYVNVLEGDRYLPELMKDALGKVDVGKSCVRFRRVEDLDIDAFLAMIRRAARGKGAGEKEP